MEYILLDFQRWIFSNQKYYAITENTPTLTVIIWNKSIFTCIVTLHLYNDKENSLTFVYLILRLAPNRESD